MVQSYKILKMVIWGLYNAVASFTLSSHHTGQSGQVAQRELEAERARVSRIQTELEDLRGRYEEKSREAAQAREQLLEERKREREDLQEERRRSSERSARLQAELEEERKRVAELLTQVQMGIILYDAKDTWYFCPLFSYKV